MELVEFSCHQIREVKANNIDEKVATNQTSPVVLSCEVFHNETQSTCTSQASLS